MVRVRKTNKSLSIKDRYRGIKKDQKEDIVSKSGKYERNVLKKDHSDKMIIKYAIKNERTAKAMEKDNTLVFVVDVSATKPEIKKAVTEKYNTVVKKVNTLVKFKKHEKKAFVRFAEEGKAVEIAGQVGIL
ncbi:Rpl23a [Ecytonucleospora hepatopenaei]|uniref:Rpl23a n=1 Tax=Ecytonucleospora hepatopenaei TaxID=646526 RepID=A0A1W0E5D9_9MICR|nr:Rpl23a [Ecytonucleospora hepatopenaei]